jgi:hypothetical protein
VDFPAEDRPFVRAANEGGLRLDAVQAQAFLVELRLALGWIDWYRKQREPRGEPLRSVLEDIFDVREESPYEIYPDGTRRRAVRPKPAAWPRGPAVTTDLEQVTVDCLARVWERFAPDRAQGVRRNSKRQRRASHNPTGPFTRFVARVTQDAKLPMPTVKVIRRVLAGAAKHDS